MKAKLIIIVAVVVIAAVAAFVVAGSGTKINAAELEKMRGTDGYYADSETLIMVDAMGVPPELIANTAEPSKMARFAFDVQYKLGKEWVETPELAVAAFAAKSVEIRSAMILMIAARTSSEMIGGGNAVQFLEQIRQTIDEIVFPKKMGRVEKVMLKQMVIQG